MVGNFARYLVSWRFAALAGLALALAPGLAQAQFTQVDVGLPDWLLGKAAWGDYDNDGDLDVLSGGGPDLSDLVVNENDGGVFTPIPVGLPALRGTMAWGDYDNDGDLDLLIVGQDATNLPLTEVYENDGGLLTPVAAGLPAVRNGNAAWGDYDNDGDLDILLTGRNAFFTVVSEVYENDAGVFTPIGAGLAGVQFGHVAWGDYDNDGDLDIALTGEGALGQGVTAVYENNAGVFAPISTGLPGVRLGFAAWGDYDNDGDLDMLLAGEGPFGIVLTDVFKNDGGVFTPIGAGLVGLRTGDAAWGDYDNDGDLDIVITGQDALGGPVTELYNNDAGQFTAVPVGLPAVQDGAVAWGDYDDDGDVDLVLAGKDADGFWLTQVWRNDLAMNQPPEADAGGPYVVESRDAADGSTSVVLDGSGSFDADGDALTFAWSASAGVFDDPSLGQPTLDVTGVAPGTVIDVTLSVDDGQDGDVAVTTVEVQDTWAPVIICPDDIVQAPASPDGNTVTYTPAVADAADATPDVQCDPPSGSLFAVGTTTVVTVTATDDSGNSTQCTFRVKILSAGELLTTLVDNVGTLGLDKGSETKVMKLLDNVQRLYTLGKTKPACVSLQIVIDEVNKSIGDGDIEATSGQAVIDSANDLCTLLGG